MHRQWRLGWSLLGVLVALRVLTASAEAALITNSPGDELFFSVDAGTVDSSDWGKWSNIQLQGVPEPSNLIMLMGAGAIAFAVRRSKRRQSWRVNASLAWPHTSEASLNTQATSLSRSSTRRSIERRTQKEGRSMSQSDHCDRRVAACGGCTLVAVAAAAGLGAWWLKPDTMHWMQVSPGGLLGALFLGIVSVACGLSGLGLLCGAATRSGAKSEAGQLSYAGITVPLSSILDARIVETSSPVCPQPTAARSTKAGKAPDRPERRGRERSASRGLKDHVS